MTVSPIAIRVKFLDYLFGESIGFLCIATAQPSAIQTTFEHTYFEWPIEHTRAAEFIERMSIHHNVWFCVSLLRHKSATKDACLPGSFVWADLDRVTPGDLEALSIPAPCTVQTSPGNFQAFWRLQEDTPPDVREDLSKRVTYYVGADKGGWACNKLMRVPNTINFKYDHRPKVELLSAYETRIPASVFEGLPDANVDTNAVPVPDMPDLDKLPDASAIVYKYSHALLETAFRALYSEEPEPKTRSHRMWRLINICLEARMEKEEVMAVVMGAACNKYKQDGRPLSYLWREVVKADALRHKGLTLLGEYKPLIMPELVDPDMDVDNFITQYKDWAASATDAVVEYHELCAFMLLSALLCSSVKLEASFGKLVPNLWGLVLGDSTLTRKTTAMQLAMAFLREIDKDTMVATDGSPEGLITVLGQRPDQVSVYYKDEVSGLFSAINKKSYLADMPELLTHLYDVPSHYSRVLRKETISVNSPYFIFFGGGIKEKVYAEISEDYVISGFLPRFLLINGYADINSLRPVGPPSPEITSGRAKILVKLMKIYEDFCLTIQVKVGTQLVPIPQVIEAWLNAEAWDTFAEYDDKLTRTAADSPNAVLAQPTFTRLAFSLLKMAVLLAACRGHDSAKRLEVTTKDLQEAAWFVQRWGRHSVDLISNAGTTKSERIIDRIMRTITKNPGCTKSMLMRTHSNLSSKEMGDLLTTICDRGLVHVGKQGRGLRFWSIEEQEMTHSSV